MRPSMRAWDIQALLFTASQENWPLGYWLPSLHFNSLPLPQLNQLIHHNASDLILPHILQVFTCFHDSLNHRTKLSILIHGFLNDDLLKVWERCEKSRKLPGYRIIPSTKDKTSKDETSDERT